MQLTRMDRWAIGGVILSWAMVSLLCFTLLPPRDWRAAGAATLMGLLFAGAAIFGILWRAARRAGEECDTRMATMGFARERIEPDRIHDLVPPELRRLPFLLDGFEYPGSGSGAHAIYIRARGELRTMLYGLWVGTGRHRCYHMVACLESRSWVWPEFSLAPVEWGDDDTILGGGTPVEFEEDPDFSRRWRLHAPNEPAVRRLFTDATRSSLVNLAGTRLSASGQRLFLYARSRRLLEEQVAAWLEAAGLLAAGLAGNATPRQPLVAVGR